MLRAANVAPCRSQSREATPSARSRPTWWSSAGAGQGLPRRARRPSSGRRVVLIEKGASLGGSTAWSVGSITATGTPHQRRAGIAGQHATRTSRILGLLAGSNANRDNLALRRILVDETPKAFDWLLSTGLVFTGPNAEPPHRAPRMHNVLPNSRAFPATLGAPLPAPRRRYPLGAACGAAAGGGRPRAGRGGARRRWVHDCIQGERGGVVLATGDFSADREMKAEHRLGDGRQDRARQCAEHRRRPQAGTGGRRPHRQRRHRARAEAALRAAGARQPGAAAAAVARRRPRRQIRGRAPARLSAAPGADEVRHDRARRRGQISTSTAPSS